jgi:hypothetical protein
MLLLEDGDGRVGDMLLLVVVAVVLVLLICRGEGAVTLRVGNLEV